MFNRLFLLFTFTLLLLPMTLFAQDAAACTLEPRLVVGEAARRIPGDVNNLRDAPGTAGERAGELRGGASVMVLAEPICADGYWWWQVGVGDQALGWTAEGDPATGEYWLEPRGAIELVVGEDGITRAFVTAPDGFSEREGCLAPPEDYTREFIGYAEMNTRTLAMLDHATTLYRALTTTNPTWDFRNAITQGGYTGGTLAASFGTHDGGGAVDLSVRSAVDWSILYDEIPLMIDALRVAGFAAWLRSPDQLYAGSVIHIHAIAVGDAELSAAARAQIDGEFGYLRGYNGLPPEWGGPAPDEHGGPIICRWMVTAGFDDLRPEQP